MEKALRKGTHGHYISRCIWHCGPVILYAALIFYFSSLPFPEEKLPGFLFKQLSDKFLHLVEYALLGLLLYRLFRWAAGPAGGRQALMLAILAGSFYGLTDEIHQSFVPFRESSWLDWGADTIGVVLGSFASHYVLQGGASLQKLIDIRTMSS